MWFPQTHQQDDEFPGEPLYHRPYFGSYVRRPLQELLEPSIHLPRSRITRDPWWWDYPTLRPYSPYSRYPYTSLRYPLTPSWRSPYYLRDSYLSPIKRTYLWSYHPHRPFCEYSYPLHIHSIHFCKFGLTFWKYLCLYVLFCFYSLHFILLFSSGECNKLL